MNRGLRILIILTLLWPGSTTSGFSQESTEEVRGKGRPDLPGIFLIDLGLNFLVSPPANMEIEAWGSKSVNLYYMYPIKLGAGTFTLNPGIGLGLDKYSFKDDVTLVNSAGLTTVELIDDLIPMADVKKTRPAVNHVDFPLEIRWHLKKYDHRSSFKVAVGGRGGIRYSAHTKIKYSLDGEDIKLKNKQPYNTNLFRYGAYARIGIGGFNVFYYYGFNELFESGKGPSATETNQWQIGISIAGF